MKHELNTDTEETMNRSEQRLATIERSEHRGRVNREPREPRETISARRRAEVGAVRRPCLVKAGRGGKRWDGKRGFTALGGWENGKAWNFYRLATGFSHLETAISHLFPHKSTQVVDFPRICTVRLFWGCPEILATDETQIIHRWGQEVEREGTGRRVNHGWGNDGHRFAGEMI